MREIRDRRDRTSWTYPIPQHISQPITTSDTDHHLSYPDPEHCSVSNPLSLTTSCHPTPLSCSGSPHLHTNSSPSALLPPLPSVYKLHNHQNHLFVPTTGSQRTPDTPQADQPSVPQYPAPDHLHRQLAPLPPSFTMMTETWYGLIQTPRDAYLLLEACRIGRLYRITRRLTDLERSHIIRPGAVFVWEEKEAGIKRWTDHVRWSPSRVSGAFLIYSELLSASARDSHSHSNDPLLKQSFSSTTLDGDKLHLIAYYSKTALDSGLLPTPMLDTRLREIVVPPGIYPDHRATGGVEDNAVRERQRTSLIPRSSSSSLLQIQSSTSTDSTSSNVVTSRMQPETPTSSVTPMSVAATEQFFSHRGSFTGPGPHRSTPSSKSHYPNDSKYSPSRFFGGIYPISQGVVDNHTTLSERGGRWQVPDWVNPSGVVSNASDSRASYGRTGTPGASVSLGPTLAPLTTWPVDIGERVNERRFSAPGHSTFAANGHSFHPYARPNDTRRSNQDVRAEHLSERGGQSHEPATAPGTPNPRGYNLPVLHHTQPLGTTGPPTSTKSDSPKSTVGAPVTRSGDHFPSLSPSFASAGAIYQLHSTSSGAHTSLQKDDQTHDPKDNNASHHPAFATHHHHPADGFHSHSSPSLQSFDQLRSSQDIEQRNHGSSQNVEPGEGLDKQDLSHTLSRSLQRPDSVDVHRLPLSMDRYGGFHHQLTVEEESETFMTKVEDPN